VRRVGAALVLATWLCPGLAAAAICEEWVASMVSAQGTIQARRAGESEWLHTGVGDRFCPGDSIRALDRSRAAVLLRNEAVLRLDQNTTITLTVVKDVPASWVELLRGIVHFLSRLPRGLKVVTPFVNGTVEGTEFVFEVAPDRAILTVLEGRVAAENAMGQLTVASGQAVVARPGEPPIPLAVVRPRDAVQWALYYPSILDYRATDFPDTTGEDWPARVRRSIEAYRKGDLAGAFASLEGARADIPDPRFFTYRAVLLLSVGRVEEGKSEIVRALALDPKDGQALALQSLIAVVQNEKDEALRLARSAIELSPGSAGAWIALSYAQQASFDLDGARRSLEEAVKLDPQSPTAHARLAEIWLSLGKLGEALAEANEAARLNPDHARTQTVEGFAYLAQVNTKAAQEAFQRAIALDPADPLPRLGLGLTRIRTGDLDGGRREIEIAAALDPDNSLVRSYLGKAYYEEKRDSVAVQEFERAKTLDPNDPTPWFYDAIEKQSVNRPVEALHDLQQAIDLNDNRAVYRSRLLLDEDLAARSASLARIYDDLGFRQLALAEGWKSVSTDPANYSAHRFLADSYSVLPHHEVARVSELLQSQLLQPINLVPVEPQRAASRLFILSGTGPTEPGFNEFNALFERNRLSAYGSGVVGGNSTYGDSLALAGLWNQLSFSLGQFHYETNGFRQNNDLTQDIYNVFLQGSLSYQTSLFGEFRDTRLEKGDLPLRFDPDRFNPTLRQHEDTDSARLGFRHAFTPGSQLIASAAYGKVDASADLAPDISIKSKDEGYTGEIQHLLRWGSFDLTSGAGYFRGDRKDRSSAFGFESAEDRTIQHTNFYLYSSINYPKQLVTTLGASVDLFDGIVERDQANPKVGLAWTPLPGTTLRGAVFRVVKRTLVSNQTIEPTQVAGFNQFFDDPEGTTAWRYGIAVDQTFSRDLHAGAELSRRDLRVPFTDLSGPTPQILEVDWREEVGRAYVYWTPHPWWGLSLEYYFERLRRDPAFVGEEEIRRVRTHRVPVGINFFHPSGVTVRLQATYVNQHGEFGDPVSGTVSGGDQFIVVDAAVAYRLPRRWGLVSLEVKNLFDRRFRFQESDPASPIVSPELLILGKLTLAY
jgi:tetratricopeptide (TPR) repeat protein